MNRRILIPFLTAASLMSGDTLVMTNGSSVDGSFVSGSNRTIRFAVGDKVNSYNLAEVASISFSGGSGPGASTSGGQQSNSYPNSAQSTTATDTGRSGAGEIPAGTEIVIRMIDAADSQYDQLGKTYRASVDQPVVVNGQTIIPRGADVITVLTDARKSGKISGKTELTLNLQSVTVNGRTYDANSTTVEQASGSRGARSTKVIGGTAALGAIIGAIAGGGKGAAIGAGSGAAVGTAAEVATSGQRVKIPAETRLTFSLQAPLEL